MPGAQRCNITIVKLGSKRNRNKITREKTWRFFLEIDLSWTERTSDQDVLKIVGKERSLIDSVRMRVCKMVGYTPRYPEDLYSTIIEGIFEREKVIRMTQQHVYRTNQE